ncbi:MAG: LytR/AlgR family response regulator transcription factor [Bacteroidia bacterium]
MKCLIIDDEPLARAMVLEYLQAYPEFQVLGEYGDGFAGVKGIMEHQPDLVFLDIQMPKITGFEMLELLDEKPAIIFTTAYDSFALKAFEAHAIDYLLKPISQQRFDEAIKRFKQMKPELNAKMNLDELLEEAAIQKENKDRIIVKQGSLVKILGLDQISRLEAYDDYVKIKVDEQTYLKKQTLAHFEKLLPETQFVRVHRSHIIHLKYLNGFDGHDYCILKNGEKIPISKTGYQKLKVVLGM